MLLRALWAIAIAGSVTGCAQLFGLEETSRGTAPSDAEIDARPIDAPVAPVDAAPCVGGDARVVDTATGHCYVLFLSVVTRNQARAQCATLGSTTRLASISSAAENQLIANLVGMRDVFLGGNDEAVEGSFVWDDGTAVVLTNWNTGEPNNGMGQFEEDCIIMRNSDTAGKWDDRPCAPVPNVGLGSYPFVCERP